MIKYLLVLCLLFLNISLYPQEFIPIKSDVYVDDNGILKWKENNQEVSLFGVNYTAPFAYSYRALKKLNISVKDAIDIDVYHMKRLGFNAYRIHVWDREVTDSSGNLLDNEHLDMFDYLLKKLADNGIKTILTPIAWWGTGWPEPDIITPGFSQKYTKVELITKPWPRAAQRNYLKQFINHINPYTKHSYKDDPAIIAMEIINEPRHPKDADSVTNYVNEMYDVLRNAGYKKPIFYNISENWSTEQAHAVSRSKVQGISFQWYPTALVHNKMLKGNFLVNINHYKIPSEGIADYNKKAKMVYEFDAADIGNSYIYPAMARSFREAGMQFAAMFSYDPAQIAWSNTEYPTHFVNLLYAPSKAISLMIAGKAFRSLPLYKSYGEYPASNSFERFRVSYEEDLSEMNSEKEFYYSNNTSTIPVSIDKLEHVAGYGSSPVITYNGTGAYFLDKINDNTWVLEIYPDAVWIDDPFSKTSLKREVSRLFFNESNLKINLPSFPENFYCYSLKDVSLPQNAKQKRVNIKPGIYIISNTGISEKELVRYHTEYYKDYNLYLPENKQEYFVKNNTVSECREKKAEFSFTIASEHPVDNAVLFLRRPGWRGYESHKLNRVGKYDYKLQLSSPVLRDGIAEYCIEVKTSEGYLSFPGYEQGSPNDWDFSSKNLWKIYITGGKVITLFDPLRDYEEILYPHFSNSRKFFTDLINSEDDDIVYNCRIESSGTQEYPFRFMKNVSECVKGADLNNFNTVLINARSLKGDSGNVYLNLLFNDGVCLSAELPLEKDFKKIKIPLKDFLPSERLLLPDSYPLFLSKIWSGSKDISNDIIDIRKLDFIQFTIENKKQSFNYGIEIKEINLVR